MDGRVSGGAAGGDSEVEEIAGLVQEARGWKGEWVKDGEEEGEDGGEGGVEEEGVVVPGVADDGAGGRGVHGRVDGAYEFLRGGVERGREEDR